MQHTLASSRTSCGRWRRLAAVLLLALLAGSGWALGPARAQPGPQLAPPPRSDGGEVAAPGAAALAAGPTVDPSDRAASVQFYLDQYVMASAPDHGWSGSVAGCAPGTTSAAFQAAVARRINYFRAMAGVPAAISFDAGMNAKAQAAALMMSANGDLDHAPPAGWACYSDLGAQGAGSSNLGLGSYGWSAIDLYMYDPGASNYFVGHRRWVLHPHTRQMGTGDVPPSAGRPAAHALAVFGGSAHDPAPAIREPEGFVAWPPRGYVPYTVVYPRWSFSYPGANFSATTVTMRTGGGAPVALAVQPVENGYGLNTLVWEPSPASSGFSGSRPAADLPFDITVSNVLVGGQARSFSYRVTIIDVARPPSGLSLAAAALVENAPAGTPAGTLSASGATGEVVYSLVAGPGDDDNGRFYLDGATLRTAGPLDFEQQAAYSVRVQAASAGAGGATSAALTVIVQDANDPPSIAGTSLIAPLGQPFRATLRASDQDSGDTVALWAAGLPAWLSFVDNGDGTATIDGTPAGERAGPASFTLYARDSQGAEASRRFTIAVGSTATYLPLLAGAPGRPAGEE